VKAYFAGEIRYLGPDYNSYFGGFQAVQEWVNCWEHYYEPRGLEGLREMDERYRNKIRDYDTEDLARIIDLQSQSMMAWSAHALRRPDARRWLKAYHKTTRDKSPARQVFSWAFSWRKRGPKELEEQHPTERGETPNQEPNPIRFLGTNHCMGMVSSAAREGDIIVRFWGCDAALVLRKLRGYRQVALLDNQPNFRTTTFMLVGRADVADPVDQPATSASEMLPGMGCSWIENSTGFSDELYLDMDLLTLQKATSSITWF